MSLKGFNARELVEFKGSKRGIIVNVKKSASFDEIQESIIDRLESAVGFFNGAKIHEINCEYLDDIQIIQIKHNISSRFDVEFTEEPSKPEIHELKTKYVNTLRSGENIEFDGDVVVMADMKSGSQVNSTSNVVVMGSVESGAKIVANKNVIVMGSIDGFIHAGSMGNENSYVVAGKINAKILKIAQNIAEDPDDDIDDVAKTDKPEIALVSDSRIVIESYSPKNTR